MKRVLPFSLAEYAARLRHVRNEMARRDLELLLVSSPDNIFYLTGYHTVGYFGFQILLVPRKGKPVLLVRRVDRENVLTLTWLGECRVYQDNENPIEVAARTSIAGGWGGRRRGDEHDGDVLAR